MQSQVGQRQNKQRKNKALVVEALPVVEALQQQTWLLVSTDGSDSGTNKLAGWRGLDVPSCGDWSAVLFLIHPRRAGQVGGCGASSVEQPTILYASLQHIHAGASRMEIIMESTYVHSAQGAQLRAIEIESNHENQTSSWLLNSQTLSVFVLCVNGADLVGASLSL